MTFEDVAWAAGFFDGEGCIGVHRDRGRYGLRLTVTQNDRRPLVALQQWFGGNVEHERSVRQERYRWVVTYAKARAFLWLTLRYLRVKRERAELALSVSPAELAHWPSRRSA